MRGSQCHPCVSRNPVRLSPPRERPAVPKAPPGEGATVSFPRKQESSRCHSCVSRNPGFFGCAPWSPSRASGNPVRLSPPRERPAVPKAPPGEGATVSFLHKQELRLLCTTPRVTAAQAAVQNDAGFPRTRFLPSSTEAGTQQPALLLPPERPIGRFLRLHCSPAANRTRAIFGPW